jgi:hypothetical protein
VTATITIDWQRETAVADWGCGVYALRGYRDGVHVWYEIRTPTGSRERVGGFRTGVRLLFDKLNRECG